MTLLTGLSDQMMADQAWSGLEEGLREWQDKDAESTREIVCPLTSITSRGSYFQCIAIPIRLSDSNGLAQLHEILRRKFKLEQAPYWPHISLLYAHLEERVALEHIKQLSEIDIFRDSDGSMAFGVDTERRLHSVTFGAVELWRTGDDVGQWKMMQRRAL